MGRFVFFKKKERWSATWLGHILNITILFFLIILFTKTIHPFLAENKPVESNIMVLEGFVPDYVVENAKGVFIRDYYKLMLITGKKRMKGSHLDAYQNDGEYTAATLEKLGFEMTKVVVVPVDDAVKKDRTYESGKAVKKYLDQLHQVETINIVTIGCHARRTRYLFEQSLGKNITIGVIAIENQEYDPDRWWQSSAGFRQVMQETIAWTYARFFFFP